MKFYYIAFHVLYNEHEEYGEFEEKIIEAKSSEEAKIKLRGLFDGKIFIDTMYETSSDAMI